MQQRSSPADRELRNHKCLMPRIRAWSPRGAGGGRGVQVPGGYRGQTWRIKEQGVPPATHHPQHTHTHTHPNTHEEGGLATAAGSVICRVN